MSPALESARFRFWSLRAWFACAWTLSRFAWASATPCCAIVGSIRARSCPFFTWSLKSTRSCGDLPRDLGADAHGRDGLERPGGGNEGLDGAPAHGREPERGWRLPGGDAVDPESRAGSNHHQARGYENFSVQEHLFSPNAVNDSKEAAGFPRRVPFQPLSLRTRDAICFTSAGLEGARGRPPRGEPVAGPGGPSRRTRRTPAFPPGRSCFTRGSSSDRWHVTCAAEVVRPSPPRGGAVGPGRGSSPRRSARYGRACYDNRRPGPGARRLEGRVPCF